MTTEMIAWRIKAHKVEKYIGPSNLLSQSEFANRIKFISTSTQRGIRLSNLISKKHCSFTMELNRHYFSNKNCTEMASGPA